MEVQDTNLVLLFAFSFPPPLKNFLAIPFQINWQVAFKDYRVTLKTTARDIFFLLFISVKITRKLNTFLKNTSWPPHLPLPICFRFVFLLLDLRIMHRKYAFFGLILSKTMLQRYAQKIQVPKNRKKRTLNIQLFSHLLFIYLPILTACGINHLSFPSQILHQSFICKEFQGKTKIRSH